MPQLLFVLKKDNLQEMAVFEIFSYCVKYRYKSSICSSASIFIVFITIIMILGPFLLIYRSNGFWLRTATFREQPEVHFKHQYVLIAETEEFDRPIICSTFVQLNDDIYDGGYCALVKSREIDEDEDGKHDELSIEFSLNMKSKSVYGIKLLLIFDYKLHAVSSMEMECLGYLQHSAPSPAAQYEVAADLHLVQRKALETNRRDTKYNSSIIDTKNPDFKTFDLGFILREYSRRSVSTILSNVYSLWTTGLSSDGPFILKVLIHYPEENLTYKPKFWHVVKWAWIQYVSVLLIFLYVFKSVKIYVFRNRLVPSIEAIPWKKSF